MDFLEKFRSANSSIAIGTIPKIFWLAWDVDSVLSLNKDKDLYFRVWISSASVLEPGFLDWNSVSDSNITEINRIFIDLDIRKIYKKLNKTIITDEEILEIANTILEEIKNHPLFSQRTYIIFSGNGLHIYYIWDYVSIDKEAYSNLAKQFYDRFDTEVLSKNEKLSIYETDKSCRNISRLWRLVGSFNHKRKEYWLEPIEVKILHSQEANCDYLINTERYISEQININEEKEMIHYSGQEKTIYKTMRSEFIKYISNKLNLYIKSDWRNFGWGNNSWNKAFFMHEKANKLICLWDSYVKCPITWFYTFVTLVMELEWINRQDAINFIIKENKKPISSTLKSFDWTTPDLDRVYSFTRWLEKIDIKFWRFDLNQLILLTGKTWIWKTQYTFFLAEKNALRWNKTVYITLEMPAQKLAERYARQKAGISKIKRSDKDLSDEEKQIFIKHHHWITNIENFKIVSSENTRIDAIEQGIKDLASQWRTLFIIDNLGFFSGWDNELERFAEVSRRLKELTNNLPISIILLHHMKKSIREDAYKPWGLSEIRWNQKLSDDADKIVQIRRNMDPDVEDEEEKNTTTLILHKDREFGDIETINLQFKEWSYS